MKKDVAFIVLFLLNLLLAMARDSPVTAAGHSAEAVIDAFLGKAKFEMQKLFDGERFPNVVVATDGTVVATWGRKSIKARRSEDGGKTWGPEITIANPGFHGGGALVNEATADILVFVQDKHPPASAVVYRSKDHGRTWQDDKAVSPITAVATAEYWLCQAGRSRFSEPSQIMTLFLTLFSELRIRTEFAVVARPNGS